MIASRVVLAGGEDSQLRHPPDSIRVAHRLLLLLRAASSEV